MNLLRLARAGAVAVLCVCVWPGHAEITKSVHLESDPSGASIALVVGSKREVIGATPLDYRAEFHSEMSVLRFVASKAGYVARELEITPKDDRILIRLVGKPLTASPKSISEPGLRQLQERLNPTLERVVRDALKVQTPFTVDVARELRVESLDAKTYLVVPILVTQAPASFHHIGAENGEIFLVELWAQLGDAFAMPLARATTRTPGLEGIVLEVDYSMAQRGLDVAFRSESSVEMVCQPGTTMKSVWNSCATQQSVQDYNAQTHSWTSRMQCAGGFVSQPAYDPCATRVPVTHMSFVADPQASFSNAKTKARYVGSISALAVGTHAQDVYGKIGAVLIDTHGAVMTHHGALPASLLPK
jgi:hypothetical protein